MLQTLRESPKLFRTKSHAAFSYMLKFLSQPTFHMFLFLSISTRFKYLFVLSRKCQKTLKAEVGRLCLLYRTENCTISRQEPRT